MSWARYDDEFPMNRKVAHLIGEGQLGLAAIGLHLLANTWSRHNGTAGVIEAHVPTVLAGPVGKKAAKLLQDVGMFDAIEGGWAIHDFAEFHDPDDPEPNKSASERKKELSEKRAAAGRRGGLAKASKATDLLEAKGVAKPWQCSSPDPVPDPVPSRSSSPTTHHHPHGVDDEDDGRYAEVISHLVERRVTKFPARTNALAYRSRITTQITADFGEMVRDYLQANPEHPAQLVADRLALEIA